MVDGALLDWARREDLLSRTERARGVDLPVRRSVSVDAAELVPGPGDPEEDVDERDRFRLVVSLFDRLRPRERRCLEACYLRGLTLEQHAAEEGCTTSRACQVRKEAIARLRCAIAAAEARTR